VEEYEAAPETTGQIRLDGDEIIERLAQDPFYKLEHGKRDQQKLAAAKPVVDSLLAINQRQWSDPYQRSRDLRKRFRDEKEAGQKRLVESRQLANKFGIGISGVLRIAEETKEDRLASMRTEFNLLNDEAVRRQQQAEIGGIFDSPQMPLKSTTQLLGAELKRRKLQQELSNSSNISLDDVILRPRSK
jgi:coiled-coil domain-containing protein 130